MKNRPCQACMLRFQDPVQENGSNIHAWKDKYWYKNACMLKFRFQIPRACAWKFHFFAARLMVVYVNPCMLGFALHSYLAYLINIPRVNGGKRTPKKAFAWVMLCLILRMIKFRQPVQKKWNSANLKTVQFCGCQIKMLSVYVIRVCEKSTSLCRKMHSNRHLREGCSVQNHMK